MILIEISNASELVAAKLGDLLERLTPDKIDHSTVEDLVVKELLANLSKEGIKGDIYTSNGIAINEKNLSIDERFKLRTHKKF